MNISNWILKNQPLYDINIGDDLKNTLKKINSKNFYLVGENDYGYYYNKNGYRFGFSDDIIDEIGIDLLQTKGEVIIKKGKYKIDLKTAKIHKVLSFLNDISIKWTPLATCDRETLTIILDDSKIFFFFDIYEGVLDKISKSNIFSSRLL